MRRIVAVSWAMPPRLVPRALQVARLLDGLRMRGWESVTVCAARSGSESPESLDPDLGAWYRERLVTREVETDESRAPSPWWLRELRRMSPPDDLREANWERRARLAATALVAERGADALVTFAQPWSDHRIGLRLKRRFPALPWIAHFSDPWVDSPYYAHVDPERLGAWMADERRVVASADAVVFVSEETARLVMAKYPAAWSARAHVVPHAFDRELLPSRPEVPALDPHAPLRLVHTGNLYAGRRSPAGLFAALRRLKDDAGGKLRLRIEFVGPAAPDVERAAREAGLEDVVSFRGPIEYRRALEMGAGAHALVVIDAPAERNVFLPSKVVDYVMLDRPILGLTPGTGATASVLRELGHPVVEPDDVEAIAEVLRLWLASAARGRLSAPALHFAGRDRFSSDRVTARFVEVLDAVRRPQGRRP